MGSSCLLRNGGSCDPHREGRESGKRLPGPAGPHFPQSPHRTNGGNRKSAGSGPQLPGGMLGVFLNARRDDIVLGGFFHWAVGTKSDFSYAPKCPYVPPADRRFPPATQSPMQGITEFEMYAILPDRCAGKWPFGGQFHFPPPGRHAKEK
jgi:hypothetical protein